jgi:hypothetical protein
MRPVRGNHVGEIAAACHPTTAIRRNYPVLGHRLEHDRRIRRRGGCSARRGSPSCLVGDDAQGREHSADHDWCNPEEGLVQQEKAGFRHKLRPIATICCWPPLNCPAGWLRFCFKIGNSGRGRIGDAVAVFAQGPIGLCATAGARLMGATRIIAVESVPPEA